jgi:hypothetical protein
MEFVMIADKFKEVMELQDQMDAIVKIILCFFHQLKVQ